MQHVILDGMKPYIYWCVHCVIKFWQNQHSKIQANLLIEQSFDLT